MAAAQRGSSAKGGDDDVSGIVTPKDECEHWRRLAMGYSGGTAEQKRRAEEFWGALQARARARTPPGRWPRPGRWPGAAQIAAQEGTEGREGLRL